MQKNNTFLKEQYFSKRTIQKNNTRGEKHDNF